MSPLFLMNLLSIYATHRPGGPTSIPRTDAIEQAIQEGLIEPHAIEGGVIAGEYRTTAKGNFFVAHILNTPRPEITFSIPERA